MPVRVIELMKRMWPAGLVAIGCGAIYCALLCFLRDAIEAAEEFRAILDGDGPYTLFFLTSLVLGWGVIAVLEHRMGVAGWAIWAIGLPWWFASIGGGFMVAGLVSGRLPDVATKLVVLCAVTTCGTGAFRTYFGELE